jgi:hypothetical protein
MWPSLREVYDNTITMGSCIVPQQQQFILVFDGLSSFPQKARNISLAIPPESRSWGIQIKMVQAL